MTNIDRQTAEHYLALLRADRPRLTPTEAELVDRWAGIQRPEPAPRGFPWVSLIAGACLWTVAILTILLGCWVLGA